MSYIKKLFNFKLPKNNDFIEIGGGYGDLSNILIKSGFNLVLFIEPDISKFHIAKSKLKNINCLNLDINKINFEKINSSSSKVTVIMQDVIEHISEKSQKKFFFELQKKYIETDSLGGIDPYSASKSAAEIIIESYAKSYFYDHNNFPIINVARGGNIIGGGDWSKDRLFPDYVRSITSKNYLNIRSLLSIRPWHHVLDLVSGYFLNLS